MWNKFYNRNIIDTDFKELETFDLHIYMFEKNRLPRNSKYFREGNFFVKMKHFLLETIQKLKTILSIRILISKD